MWLPSIDYDATQATIRQDLYGDWYRDPWGWPEIEWAITQQPSILHARLNGRGSSSLCLVDVPKENFATRPAVILDPIDRLAYQALVGRTSGTLIGKLDHNVFGWRLPRSLPKPGFYAPNDDEWDTYRAHIEELARHYNATLKTDVVSFFASIPIDRLCAEIERLLVSAGMSGDANRLTSFLQSWNKVPGRSGLPQRCQASSVLANLYLSKIDDILRDVSEDIRPKGKGKSSLIFSSPSGLFGTHSFARWMDDIWVFGNDPGKLRMTQVEIERNLATLGLQLNVAKTKLLEGQEVIEHVLKIEHSAIDEGLAMKPTNNRPLYALIEKICSDKETANRTTVRFVAHRMKKRRNFSKVDRIVDVAQRMPHVADHLGRLFRDSKRAVRLQDWFLDYSGSSWGGIEWPTAQFATMFPSRRTRISNELIRYLSDELSANAHSLPLLATTAQRLAAWNPSLAQEAIVNAIGRVSGPLERRVLALAGLKAGIPRTTVKSWLSDFPENAVTVSMLSDMSFRPLPYVLDFAGEALGHGMRST